MTSWFNGDTYTTTLTAGSTGGAVGMVRASVPPGRGPAPHLHHQTDEIFYVLDGELEFLAGDRMVTAGPGDALFVPRGTTHRFLNAGVLPATLLFVFTPGGPEGLFIEGGDEPQPGVVAPAWGPERLDERLLGLLAQYDTALPAPPPD